MGKTCLTLKSRNGKSQLLLMDEPLAERLLKFETPFLQISSDFIDYLTDGEKAKLRFLTHEQANSLISRLPQDDAWIDIYQTPEITAGHGGRREGAGRPSTGRDISICIRISQESNDKLKSIDNKSEYIDRLIRES